MNSTGAKAVRKERVICPHGRHNMCITATNSESAFSAAVDPNRTTEMAIAAIDRDIQASEKVWGCGTPLFRHESEAAVTAIPTQITCSRAAWAAQSPPG